MKKAGLVPAERRSKIMKEFADMAIEELESNLIILKNEIESRKPLYMNVKTGNVGSYNAWFYINENGESVNAVDLGEVVEVEWNNENGTWEEV